mgnify:CR=1 FL=1
MLFLYFLLSFFAIAQEPEIEADETIVVEAHKDFEVYVMPVVMDIQSTEVEAVMAKKTVFSYASRFAKQAKVRNERDTGYENVSIRHDIKVYDEDTIEYIWDNCNYKREPKKCAYQNNHMLLETIVTVDDHQIVVNMILYDSDLTALGSSVYTSDSKIHWIRQQEITVSQQQGLLGNSTTVHKPKEELPLKWLIPTNLLDKHISQASALLWVGVRLN